MLLLALTRFCLLVPVQIDMSPGSHIAGRFLLVKWKAHNRFRLHARVSNLLANQQAFSHEQASARMQIFCSLNTLKDQYGGKLHVRIRAYKRLCNVNAACDAALADRGNIDQCAQCIAEVHKCHNLGTRKPMLYIFS